MIIEKESEIQSDPVSDLIIGKGVTWLSFFMFFKSGEKYAIIGNLDFEKIKRLGLFDTIHSYKKSPQKALLELLDKHKPKKIAINYSIDSPSADGLSYGKYLKLIQLLKDTDYRNKLISAEEIISRLRGRKSSEEISRIKKSIEYTLKIFKEVTKYVKPGFSEKQVAQFMTDKRNKLNLEPAWEEESCPAVFSGPQKFGAHSQPTSNILLRGHVFNIDFGVIFNKYCSDLQRTWYILRENEQKAPAEVQKGFETIINSIQMSFNALKPGITGIEIDKIARNHITSQGYEEYPHALGHQVGRTAHDGSALLAPSWERYGELPFIPLEAGQVFTIEPRIYLEEYGVVTVEEMVLINENGAEFLSTPQEKIYLIK